MIQHNAKAENWVGTTNPSADAVCSSDNKSLLPASTSTVMLLSMKEALALAENSLALGDCAGSSWNDCQDPAHNHSYSAENPLSQRIKTDWWPKFFLTRCYIIGGVFLFYFLSAQDCQNLQFVFSPGAYHKAIIVSRKFLETSAMPKYSSLTPI